MDSVIKELCQYILDNINNEITLEKLESEFYYSKYYIIRAFKSYTGYTIKEFINTIKVLKTINPLIFTDDTILKIALNGGFNSQEYYSEIFQSTIGTSPLKFRKEFQNIDDSSEIEKLELKKQYLLYLQQYYNQLININDKEEKHEKIKRLT